MVGTSNLGSWNGHWCSRISVAYWHTRFDHRSTNPHVFLSVLTVHGPCNDYRPYSQYNYFLMLSHFCGTTQCCYMVATLIFPFLLYVLYIYGNITFESIMMITVIIVYICIVIRYKYRKYRVYSDQCGKPNAINLYHLGMVL
jgi:hypothetical protein